MLNGIGFAQKLNLEVDSAQHLVVRDVSLQGSTLALPGSSAEGLPGEIKQQLEELESDWRKQLAQATRFIQRTAKMSVYPWRLVRSH
ncbi:hypothetical protein EIMP300_09050 [Escherichia coli]|uniref:ATPase RavA LARA domain-containing protein n=1 Tax=Escherichia coli TaxID=562 RepID=A0A8S0FDL1_ECOLX|nr:hypothetical protein EIMP300_09050 [Escherichia coli]